MVFEPMPYVRQLVLSPIVSNSQKKTPYWKEDRLKKEPRSLRLNSVPTAYIMSGPNLGCNVVNIYHRPLNRQKLDSQINIEFYSKFRAHVQYSNEPAFC